MSFKMIHDLSKLDAAGLTQYLRDVSEYVGLDPDMGALDTIWMQNENGVGQSLVVYARRGTAEILRQKHEVSTDSLTQEVVGGSIVFTASGHNGKGRKEVATGSKFIEPLAGKAHDNAIMTASTRALRRLTMQFTGLGILDESEVHAVEPNLANPAASVTLAPALPPPSVAPNNAAGKVVLLETKIDHVAGEISHTMGLSNQSPVQVAPAASVEPTTAPAANFATHQAEFIKEAQRQQEAKSAALLAAKNPVIVADASPSIDVSKPVESTTSEAPVVDISADKTSAPKAARKPRKARNTVSLSDVEPETVSTQADSAPTVIAAPVIAAPVIPDAVAAAILPPPPPPTPAPAAQTSDFPGKPTDEQMIDYRKKVSVFTAELPSSENMGSVQKMRAFITKTSGQSPQYMTVEQWSDMIGWLEAFSAKNGMKGLISHVNEVLGVK